MHKKTKFAQWVMIEKMDLREVTNHWKYFTSLERQFIETSEYVEPSEENFSTYSMAYSKLLQLACAELDSVSRILCKCIDPCTDYDDHLTFSGNIANYKTVIIKKFPRITEAYVSIPSINKTYQPFKDWDTHDSPNWWKEYNKVKHYRHSNFKLANLKNTILSLMALKILVLYLFRIVANRKYANPLPLCQFFDSEYASQNILGRPNRELPDFE